MKTFWRLLGFLRPYRGGVLWSFFLAAASMGAGVLIPYLVGRTVDEIRRGGADLWPLALTVVGVALLRLVFSVVRRLVAGRVSLGVEFDLRNRIYSHLHSLELAFFDTQQTGQLMSRSTVDLQSVRFFLGYGLIFMLQSALTIVLAAAVMVAVNADLAAVSLAPMPLVIWVASRYGRLNRPASQEVQQRIAELTAEAEENVSGVRVVKAFAQEERQLLRFRRSVKRVFDQSLVSTRLRAFYSPFIGFLPQIGLAGLLLVGGRGVDLDVEAGRTVALVGPTGSGKTTLALLVPRLYDVTEGAVLVDGVDVRSVDLASLRHGVALVSDDAFLFSASLRDNLAYARPDASDDEILQAARRAGLEELLESLPEGLDTLVGERGLTLSGGQRQRIAIARALLAEPRILILDDATSSVDATTENRIKRALREVMEGRTTFIIAHRLSTIALADEVVVLEDGELVARGRHEELLEESPLYAEIAERGLPDRVFLTREEEREVAGL